MAMTGFKHKNGRNQLECQVKETFWCKKNIHWRRVKENMGTNKHPCYVRRCVSCNHMNSKKALKKLELIGF